MAVVPLRVEVSSGVDETERFAEDALPQVEPLPKARFRSVLTGQPERFHGSRGNARAEPGAREGGSMRLAELFETIEALFDDIEARRIAEAH